MSGLDLVNGIKTKLVETANKQGQCLQSAFGSVKRFDDFVVKLAIKSLVDGGATYTQAIDIVCGPGTVDKIKQKISENS